MFLAAAVSACATGGGEKRSAASADLDAKVAALIEEALVERTGSRAFQQLEALGCPAVPAIVKHLNDRRKLPVAYLRLQNKSANAFEAFRQYGPEVLTDALTAILNQVTGQHFGFIYNGGTEEERVKVVKGWREFVAKTPPDRLCS
jgi:hypothetical protein